MENAPASHVNTVFQEILALCATEQPQAALEISNNAGVQKVCSVVNTFVDTLDLKITHGEVINNTLVLHTPEDKGNTAPYALSICKNAVRFEPP